MSTERIDIYGGKATIKQNKFGVWQFRMWVSNEKRYYEKSLRTKRRTDAIDKAERLIADEDELLIRVSKGMKRTHIDKTLNRIFKKHIEFERGRQTRNPNRSNARYSLSKPIAIDSLQTAFALYDLIEQTEANGEKVNNYALAKQVGIEVEQRNTEEEWDIAYKRRVVSVAVSRKKKVAVDAIKSVVNGVFPS